MTALTKQFRFVQNLLCAKPVAALWPDELLKEVTFSWRNRAHSQEKPTVCMVGKMTAQGFGGRRVLCGLTVSGEETLFIGLSKQNREAF